MELFDLLNPAQVSEKAGLLFNDERQTKKILNGWLLSRELAANVSEGRDLHIEDKAAVELEAVIQELPLEISDH
ncbi:hypothetical protein NL526_28770, partial [Klebsiella pneumoniae]|nr:hypothetical protein [Klebsiella pneumoniae]